jgi:radical SAM protein with 4Fe4S-binding SPASM domain
MKVPDPREPSGEQAAARPVERRSGALANANFHPVTPASVFDPRQEESRFLEYRRMWRDNPATFTVRDFPIHLDIESTGVCNLRCPFCATTTGNWGPTAPGYMPWDLYARVIDEGAANGLCSIKLSFRGEPMLHQELSRMVEYAKRKGVLDVYFNTNATVLTEKAIHALIDAGLDRISVSFEGTTKDVYEASRVGAKYEAVLENVRRLRRIRDARGVTHPQIRLQTVLLPELEEEFPAYVAFWKDVADEVAYLDMRHEAPTDDHSGRAADWSCPFLWQRMVVLWDGTLLPCLMHGVNDFSLLSLGNVRELTIKDAWLGAQERAYRDLHQGGQAHQLEACDRCSYRAMELEKLGVPRVASPGAARAYPMTFSSGRP